MSLERIPIGSVIGLQSALSNKVESSSLSVVATSWSHLDLSNIWIYSHAQIDSHILNTSNPHSVTKTQIWLWNVENTALSTWWWSSNITTIWTLTDVSIKNWIQFLDDLSLWYWYIVDKNWEFNLKLSYVASAVNQISISNAISGSSPIIWATSDIETDVSLWFSTQWSWVFNFYWNSTQAAEIRLYEDTDNWTNYTAFKTWSQSWNITYTLPLLAPTSNWYVLSWTTWWDLSWIAQSWFTWWASVSWNSWTWLTLVWQSWFSRNLDLQTDYDWNPELRLYKNSTTADNTHWLLRFAFKTDDGTTNRTISTIQWYTTDKTDFNSLRWWLSFNVSVGTSLTPMFWMDANANFSIWVVKSALTWTNWIHFISWTPATVTNNTFWFLYNNSWTLTWVNKWEDNQFALNIPNSSTWWISGSIITIWNTQSAAMIWSKIDVWSSLQDHNSLYITWTRHSIYIWNADQAPWATTNKLYAIWWNLFWNWVQLN